MTYDTYYDMLYYKYKNITYNDFFSSRENLFFGAKCQDLNFMQWSRGIAGIRVNIFYKNLVTLEWGLLRDKIKLKSWEELK